MIYCLYDYEKSNWLTKKKEKGKKYIISYEQTIVASRTEMMLPKCPFTHPTFNLDFPTFSYFQRLLTWEEECLYKVQTFTTINIQRRGDKFSSSFSMQDPRKSLSALGRVLLFAFVTCFISWLVGFWMLLLLLMMMILFFVCLIFLFWREGSSLLWLKSRSYFISLGVENDEKGKSLLKTILC